MRLCVERFRQVGLASRPLLEAQLVQELIAPPASQRVGNMRDGCGDGGLCAGRARLDAPDALVLSRVRGERLGRVERRALRRRRGRGGAALGQDAQQAALDRLGSGLVDPTPPRFLLLGGAAGEDDQVARVTAT
jgi:hypothetical protein